MKPDLYNDRTARTHYKKFKEILYSPGVLSLSNDITDSLSATMNSVVKSDDAPTTHPETEAAEETKTEVTRSQEADKNTTEKAEVGTKDNGQKEEEKVAENTQKLAEDGKNEQEEEYNKLVQNLQDAITDAKKNIAPQNVDKATIELESVFKSPLESDIPSFTPVK